MIKQVIKSIKQVFIPRSEFEDDKVKCSVDEEQVDCNTFNESSWIGVPAPDYLPEDSWFPSPILSEKQMTVKEAHDQAVADQQILNESENKESEDIHQKLYELATANWNTVGETQLSAQGGSENFQEGPGGWNSGTGMGQFK
jgi:hypothetical protein